LVPHQGIEGLQECGEERRGSFMFRLRKRFNPRNHFLENSRLMYFLHTGTGYVRAVGDQVKAASVGDPIILSLNSCGKCTNCTRNPPMPVYCDSMAQLNVSNTAKIFKTASGEDIYGQFFGQSGFASLSIVKECCVNNAKGLLSEGRKGEEEMKLFQLFRPLGCGFLTGAAGVVVAGKAKADDVVVVIGLGGVGLAAIMVGVTSNDLCATDSYSRRLPRLWVASRSSVLTELNLA
jgi:Zn-dependent alcohol dehydrogenase